MPNEFVVTYLTDPGNKQYTRMTEVFPGASWIPSPLTDSTLGTDLGAWWAGKLDQFEQLLETQPKATLEARRIRDTMLGALPALLDPDKLKPNWRRQDVANAVLTTLSDLRGNMDKALARQGKTDDLRPALDDLRNASVTLGMSAIAISERMGATAISDRSMQAFNEAFNQLFLRDLAGTLYELVGDPPKEAYLGAADTPGNYIALATSKLLDLKVGNLNFSEVLRGLGARIDEADKVIADQTRSPAERTAAQGGRQAAVLELALTGQLLRQATEERATSNANDAPLAAALSMVFAEGMRGVVNVRLPSHGTGKLTFAVDDAPMEVAGARRVADIKRQVDDRQRKDPTEAKTE